jgi:hypothetical protein
MSFEPRIMPGDICVSIWPDIEVLLDIEPDDIDEDVVDEDGGGAACVLVDGAVVDGALEAGGALV